MKILYISSTKSGMHSKSIYFDLLQTFAENGHDVTISYATNENSKVFKQNDITYLAFKSLNMVKNKNMIEKGLATVLFDYTLMKNLRKYLPCDYDLVLYSTPPITYINALKMLKRKNKKTFFYLMLKDAFPQNAVDIGILKKNGLLHKYFKYKERGIYNWSDRIGVMSEANRTFVLSTYPYLENKLEILPNTLTINKNTKELIRKDFGLPEDKKILLYGGNLGLPQAVPFILECYKTIEDNSEVILVIAGSGAQDHLVKKFIESYAPKNLIYFDYMEQSRYDNLVSISDIGLIFLDYRFTVPNFPQRLLSYISNKLPVICATDLNTDIGKIAEQYNFGVFTPSNDAGKWRDAVEKLVKDDILLDEMGENAFNYLINNCTSENAYNTIIESYERGKNNEKD